MSIMSAEIEHKDLNQEVANYGQSSMLLVSSNTAKGLYILVNNVTGEVFYSTYCNISCKTMKDAVVDGSLSDAAYEFIAKYIISRMHINWIPGRIINVSGKAGLKGTGYVVSNYSINKFNSRGICTKTVYKVRVFDSGSNKIKEFDSNRVSYADNDMFMKEYIDYIVSVLKSDKLFNIINISDQNDYFKVNITDDLNCNKFASEVYFKNHIIPDFSSATDVELEKYNKRVAKLRSDLEKWAEKFTDKTPEEKSQMIERALRKKLQSF